MEEEKILEALRQACPDAVLSAEVSLGDAVAVIRREALPEVAAFLRGGTLRMGMLLDLTCVHHPGGAEAFEMVYHFLSLETNARIRVKAGLPADNPEIASLTGLWKNAAWLEREAYDMFGVRFDGHPDLRRLLLYDGFEGHPLRKDYPLRKRQPRIPLRKAEPK
jgi:NADH-quinone oxidoreductase subunit C